MSMMLINVKSSKYCAICKYWYDPTNAYITPHNPVMNMWKIEKTAKCKCLLRAGGEVSATFFCSKFERKI